MSRAELDRIRDVYAARQKAAAHHADGNPGEHHILSHRRAACRAMLSRHLPQGLSGLRILDLGCGRGLRLSEWRDWGSDPDSMVGVDLMESLVGAARRSFPDSHWLVASAHQLPFQHGQFDVVTQAMTYSSILCPDLRRAMAAEMWRVLRPGGLILWYDMRYPNPWNSHIRPVGMRELAALFPVPPIECHSLTLLPPLARRLPPGLCRVLEHLPWLRSHALALFRKPTE